MTSITDRILKPHRFMCLIEHFDLHIAGAVGSQ